MSPYVRDIILPFLYKLGRGTVLRTRVVAELLGYSRRQVYNFFVELERVGIVTRNPRGHVWRLA